MVRGKKWSADEWWGEWRVYHDMSPPEWIICVSPSFDTILKTNGADYNMKCNHMDEVYPWMWGYDSLHEWSGDIKIWNYTQNSNNHESTIIQKRKLDRDDSIKKLLQIKWYQTRKKLSNH